MRGSAVKVEKRSYLASGHFFSLSIQPVRHERGSAFDNFCPKSRNYIFLREFRTSDECQFRDFAH
jgi:hypothetical protein